MTYPSNPTNGQKANVNGIVYTYTVPPGVWKVSTTFSGNVLVDQINANAVASSGNVSGININGTTLSATGNINGSNINGSNVNVTNVSATTVSVTTVSATGNVQAGNLRTTGLISATGNISGNYIFGNASQLTGIDSAAISNGTSNVSVAQNGNVTTNINGSAIVVVSSAGLQTQFITSPRTISANTTVGNVNAMTTGPITIADGVTVTVASGGDWSIL